MKTQTLAFCLPTLLAYALLATGCGGDDASGSSLADAAAQDSATPDSAASDAGIPDSSGADAPTGPVMCDFPMEITTGRLLHLCDPTMAATCRTFVPSLPTDPRCGDDDKVDVTLARNAEDSDLTLSKNWKVTATSHGNVNGGNGGVSQLPSATDITVTLDIGDGTLYDFVFRFDNAAGTTTLTSFAAQ